MPIADYDAAAATNRANAVQYSASAAGGATEAAPHVGKEFVSAAGAACGMGSGVKLIAYASGCSGKLEMIFDRVSTRP